MYLPGSHVESDEKGEVGGPGSETTLKYNVQTTSLLCEPS